MKIFCILLYICTISILPQKNLFKGGTVELGFNADFGTVSVVTHKAYFLSSSVAGTSKSTYALIEFRSGIFLYDQISFEPDVGFHFLQHSAPAFYLVPNLSLSYHIKEWLGWYIRGGIGYSNSTTLFGVVYKTDGVVLSNKLTGVVLNLGTGLKIFVTDDYAVRSELNYKFAQQELHEFDLAYANLTSLSLIFGISFFL